MARRIVCKNCGVESLHFGRGLCQACYQYLWRTGMPRPWVENLVLERLRAVKEGDRAG